MPLHFEKRDSLSLPGNPEKPNEDACCWTPNAACVFDGATGVSEQLLPGPSDARWIANFAARRFCAHAEDGKGGIRHWLAETALEAEHSFSSLRRRAPGERYENPYAAGIMVAVDGSQLHILWFGDCALLLKDAAGDFVLLGDAFERRESERVRVQKLRAGRTSRPAGSSLRDEFLPELRASRNLVNTGDEWLFAPDAACAAHAKSAQLAVAPDAAMLLVSDGFLALATDYGHCTPEELLSIAIRDGLAPLGKILRDIELSDSGGAQYPRFKTSDDATALLLRVCA